MDGQTFRRRHGVLKQLYQRVKDYEPFFLSPGDLQDLGIQARQVGITDDGVLQFHPCFFRPYPERVLQKYPIATSRMTKNISPLNRHLDFDSYLRSAHEYGNFPDALKCAIDDYALHMEILGPDEWFSRATDTERHIDDQIGAARKGRLKDSSLLKLGALDIMWRTKERRGEPPTSESGRPDPVWQIKNILEDSDEKFPMPHAIMTTLAHVPANEADQSLTLHEVRAIVYMTHLRTSHRPFSTHPIHPLLVISYMGQKHGRIIQASFDGKNLVLQYSQLWSFADDDTAPVELFIRYYISQL
ncbi:hypothetical protein N7474_010010, partial [Penicillium riverlandense]|uniref:uncharacterized protein n=1 Tax=Penicillium riverlandense TaxID=1903569 RepID=UPI0025497F31